MKIPTYTPRDYQLPIWKLKTSKIMLMLSRRAGKTLTLLSIASVKMIQKPISVLFLLPLAVQAKAVVWKGKTNEGLSMLDSIFPKDIVKSKNSTDMTLELFNGSSIKIAGADNVDSLVGGNYHLIIMDEAAMIKEEVLAYLLPIVNANNGTIIINSTPRYGSWFTKMFMEENQYTKYKCNVHGTNQFTPEEVESIKQEYIDRYGLIAGNAYFNTEYLLDIQAVPMHSVYIGKINQVIEPVPYKQVYASWDLGMNDSTVITFFTYDGTTMNIVDMVHGKGKTVQEYYSAIKHNVSMHFLPHDAGQVRGYVSNTTASQVLRSLGARVKVIPRTTSVMDDINYVRNQLHNIHWFNTEPVNTLRDKVLVYSNDNGKLDHCDFSDSFRYAVIGCKYITKGSGYESTSSWIDG